ncbi:MAG TPA: D-cysteine desulfhydrase family protein [Actinocrinis sp.]|nr:D-cysteine desulfhydrase family protein [Actinocrinis sp.]
MDVSPAAPQSPPRRVSLGSWPTPLERAPRLAEAIGLGPDDLWVKRDDLTGLGGGGNKIRKLEWTVAEALAEGADTLVTTGAAQSNHARLTAAAAARVGLRAVLVLAGGPEGGARGGNLALDGLFGAQVAWAGDVDHGALTHAAEDIAARLRKDGARPYLIPFGGSSPVGALGYVEAGRELLTQLPDVACAVVAVGSGGTMAGLVDALGPERVLGVHTGAVQDPAAVVADLAGRVGSSTVDVQRIRVRMEQVGAGYGRLTEPVAEALALAARTEGMVLDPIYTGRALAGLIAAVKDGTLARGTKTVFVHTGGLPGLFGHADAVARAEAGLIAYP